MNGMNRIITKPLPILHIPSSLLPKINGLTKHKGFNIPFIPFIPVKSAFGKRSILEYVTICHSR
jgi:hypothetical protein